MGSGERKDILCDNLGGMMSKNDWQIDGSPESRRKLQEYARHAMIKRLLEDKRLKNLKN